MTVRSLLMRLPGMITLSLAGWHSHAVMAQSLPQIPALDEIVRDRVPRAAIPSSDYDLRIQTPERAPVPRAIDELEFTIARIDVKGAEHYPAQEVTAVFQPLIGQTISLESLREAADKLEQRYHNDGYFLTRVFVPPQLVKDGVLTVQVVEGYVSAVNVDTQDSGLKVRLARMLAPLIGEKPVKLADIETLLLTVNDMPGLIGSSVLRPSDQFGATELILTVRPRRNEYRFSVGNSASDSLGPWTWEAHATLNRAFGRAGALEMSATAGGRSLREIRIGTLRYSEPIASSGLIASIGGLYAEARPGGIIRPLDVRSHVASISLRLRYPLLRQRNQSLFLEGGIAANSTQTDILNTRLISDRQTVIDASLLWQQSGWLDGTTTASLGIYHGTGLFGAMSRSASRPSVAGFDPRFTRVSLLGQRLQRLIGPFSAYASVQGQYSKDRLLTGEQITFGGPFIGRAYDPSIIGGDRGIGGLAELRWNRPLRDSGFLSNTQIYGFADTARATTLAYQATPRLVERLSSLGAGVRFDLRNRVHVDSYIADARKSVAGTVANDDRVIIRLDTQF